MKYPTKEQIENTTIFTRHPLACINRAISENMQNTSDEEIDRVFNGVVLASYAKKLFREMVQKGLITNEAA